MMPLSPSTPGTTTMWTSSDITSRSGVTSSKRRSAIRSGVLCQLLGLGDGLVDAADHVKSGFRQMVVLTLDHRLERAHRVFDLDELARDAGEHFGDVERLAEEALDLAGAADHQLILFAELVHAEDGD